MYFGCCIYVLLLLNMPEMAHDWINKSILFYSILFLFSVSDKFPFSILHKSRASRSSFSVPECKSLTYPSPNTSLTLTIPMEQKYGLSLALSYCVSFQQVAPLIWPRSQVLRPTFLCLASSPNFTLAVTLALP